MIWHHGFVLLLCYTERCSPAVSLSLSGTISVSQNNFVYDIIWCWWKLETRILILIVPFQNLWLSFESRCDFLSRLHHILFIVLCSTSVRSRRPFTFINNSCYMPLVLFPILSVSTITREYVIVIRFQFRLDTNPSALWIKFNYGIGN